jgi:dehydratase
MRALHSALRPRRLGAALGLLGLAAVLTACEDPPTKVTTAVNYDCEINPNHILLAPFSDDLDANYDVTAPQAVAPGAQFLVQVKPETFTVDGTPTSSGTITQVSNMVFRVAIPAGTTLSQQGISDWANVGAGTPTSAVSGGAVVVTIPGPILAGTPATLPTVNLLLTATGSAGTVIQPKIAGTSYASPGLSFSSRVTGTLLGTLNPSLACFPSPSPNLHPILISTDTKAPVITIASPVADQVVTQGSTVLADFTCDDGTGVGVATCVGTVADGAAINTATLGAKTFSVTSTDLEGKSRTVTVDYTVVAP